MPPSLPESNPKSNTQIWSDFAKDMIGYDKGYVYTLRGVYATPAEVFESYFNNRGKYVSPFTLLGVSFSIYYLISGLLVDWELVSVTLKDLYYSFLQWWIGIVSSHTDEVNKTIVDKAYNNMIVPLIDGAIIVFSTYLVAIVLPFQIIILYATSFFTRKIGYGFYHHFVCFNYYFSFSLLFLNLVIIVSLISIWLTIPFIIAFNYYFYGHFFKSYGIHKVPVKAAFLKGVGVGFIFLIALSSVIGFVMGLFMANDL